VSPQGWLLAIDDTDTLGRKPGTGRLARMLAADLAEAGTFRRRGVVRHQLLVDPAIPYTSHNSPACILFDSDLDTSAADALFARACAWLRARHAPGSDPGLCLLRTDRVPERVVAFGHHAATEVVHKEDAVRLGADERIRLAELGGTGDGVIGALAAVGLTSEGSAGRYIERSDGSRELSAPVPVADLRDEGIVVVSAARDAEYVPNDAEITGPDWIRPRLVGGRPVLFVELVDGRWSTVENKRRRGLGSMMVEKEPKHGDRT